MPISKLEASKVKLSRTLPSEQTQKVRENQWKESQKTERTQQRKKQEVKGSDYGGIEVKSGKCLCSLTFLFFVLFEAY